MLIQELLKEDLESLKAFKEDVLNDMNNTLDGLTGLPDTINYYIEKGGIPLTQMAKILNKYKTKILETFHDNWYLIDKSRMLGALLKINLNWPELKSIESKLLDIILEDEAEFAIQEVSFSHDLLTANKDRIIRAILTNMKNSDGEFARAFIKDISQQNIDWPELTIIQRSLNAATT